MQTPEGHTLVGDFGASQALSDSIEYASDRAKALSGLAPYLHEWEEESS